MANVPMRHQLAWSVDTAEGQFGFTLSPDQKNGLLDLLMLTLDHHGWAAPVKLTRQQTIVVHWLAKGLSRQEVGLKMGISEITVAAHLRRIHEACRRYNRTSLVSFCYSHGILDPLPTPIWSGYVPRTSREMNILFGWASGRTIAQIGLMDYAAEMTVKSRIREFMNKTHLRSAPQLVFLAHRQGWLPRMVPRYDGVKDLELTR